MGLLDWLKRRTAADTEMGVVPAGHSLALYPAEPLPGLVVTKGGVWLAHLGVGSDDAEAELDAVCDEIAARRSAPVVQLLAEAGDLSLLFASTLPRVAPVRGMVVWTFHQGALAGWSTSPRRMQRLLRRMHAVGEREPPLRVCAVVFGADEPDARAGIELLVALGVEVRMPEQEARVLAEVTRPDGGVVSALLGRPDPAMRGPGDGALARSQRAQDRAAARGDEGEAQRLAVAELEQVLTLALGPARAAGPVMQARALQRALLAVADGAALAPLLALLLGRDTPLLLQATPDHQVVRRAWPQVGEALATFPDLVALHWAAADMGMAKGTYVVAGLTARELFAWGVKDGLCVMLAVYRDRKTPLYIKVTADQQRAALAG